MPNSHINLLSCLICSSRRTIEFVGTASEGFRTTTRLLVYVLDYSFTRLNAIVFFTCALLQHLCTLLFRLVLFSAFLKRLSADAAGAQGRKHPSSFEHFPLSPWRKLLSRLSAPLWACFLFSVEIINRESL